MTTNDTIAGAYRMAKGMLHRFTDDLTPMEFGHQPAPGVNSAEWIVGHLDLTLRGTATRLGASGLTDIPPGVAAQFTKTGKAATEQAPLGIEKSLLNLFDEYVDAVIERVNLLSAETLDGPSTSPAPFAKTFGEGVLFGAMHIVMHAGQLSTIRRSLGKPPLV